MEVMRKLFSTRVFIAALQLVFSIATAVAAIFYVHASVIVVRAWKIALIDLTFFLAAAVLFALCYIVKTPDFRFSIVLLYFLVGAAVFALIFFPVQAALKSSVNETVAATAGVMIALAFVLASVIYQCIPAIRIHKRWENIAVAVLLLGVHIGSIVLSFSILPQGWTFKKFSNTSVTFAAASAEELKVTAEERALNKTWYEQNVLYAVQNGKKPAFDFSVGGKKLSENLSEWSASLGEQTFYADGVQSTLILTGAAHSVQATVVSVYYDATATFEWTVYLKNIGDARSATVSDFYPLSTTFDIASSTLYFSGGSYEKNDDFALYSKRLTSSTLTFDTIDGRTSRLYLPFFNLCGEDLGATVGIGWSGDWKATFSGKKTADVAVSQAELEGYLEPNEEVRSPLVSVNFYNGNPLKGFNTFRTRVKDSLPEGYGPISTCFFVGAEGQDDTANANEQGSLEILTKFIELGIVDKLDYAWFDAGWYETGDLNHWNLAIGDWVVDSKKFPNGLASVSETLSENGVELLLWYEPERVPTVSKLYTDISSAEGRESWLLPSDKDAENCLWNMGDADALEFISKRISDSIKANGVKYYRQDFNINPGSYWKAADRTLYDGRKGFAENKYVVGEYAFLDYLVQENPGLLIDNCASGGRRIDLEMCRRSIPLWRSDYNCYDYADLAEACQYQTYGLSLWLPYSSGANLAEDDVYEYRSHLGSVLFAINKPILAGDEDYVQLFRDYDRTKNYFDKQYYPLTPCTISDEITVAMQFGDEKEGVILVYAREKAKAGEITLAMNGLERNVTYDLATIEGNAITQKNGNDLMTSGFTMNAQKRSAYIILYSQAK